jgi:Inner membrane component of T3SS, cytoplasmic domain/Domain of unknown function (DUF1707)
MLCVAGVDGTQQRRDDSVVRASDRQRERAVAQLRLAYVDGALSTDTFEARAGAALHSRSEGQLARLLHDVPSAWARRVHALGVLWRRVLARDLCDDGEVTPVVLPLGPGETLVVGRSSDCDVVLEDQTVSRTHLALRYDGEGWEASDLASTNGTLLGGRRIGRAEARPGDVLTLGSALIELETTRPGPT